MNPIPTSDIDRRLLNDRCLLAARIGKIGANFGEPTDDDFADGRLKHPSI